MASFSHYQKFIPIPSEFINKYMISANATYVKVYLYGLAKCYEPECDMTIAEIADALDILETDVSKAWRYWKRVGLVHSEGKGKVVFDPIPSGNNTEITENSKSDEKPKETKTEKNADVRETKPPSIKEVLSAMETNPKIKETVMMAEHILKRTLSSREITSVYNFMDWYAMSQETVLVLLEYCANMDKTSFAYIEKVAKSWNDEGINSLDAATAVLNRSIKENKMQNKCKKIFGLDRSFTSNESNYIASWVTKFGMSESMIKAAYERTVNNTGKLSMPYMNTILRSWNEKGIKTVSQVAEKDSVRTVKKNGTQSGEYELDDMAAIERRRMLEKHKK